MQRLVRRELLSLLKGDAGLTALVPAPQIHPQTVPANPAWPFIKLGQPQTRPRRMTCSNGGIVSLAVHGFGKDRKAGASTVETAEDHTGRIGEEIERVLHEAILLPVSGERIKVKLVDRRLMLDTGEAGAFHYYALAECEVYR